MGLAAFLAPAFENLPCAGALLATGSGRTYMAGARAIAETLPLGSVAIEPERVQTVASGLA